MAASTPLSARLGRPRAAQHRMRARVATQAEPLATPRTVMPKLLVRTGRVIAQIDVLGPRRFRRVVGRLLHRRVAAVGELDLRPRAAPRARNQHHGALLTVAISASTVWVLRLFRRSSRRARSAPA